MKRIGLTLVEIVASIAILAIIGTLAFVFMGKQYVTVNNISITTDTYRDISETLQLAIEEDIKVSDGIYTTDTPNSDIAVVNPTVEINGFSIPYELFYISEDLITEGTASNFAYNFSNVNSAYRTDAKSLFAYDNVNPPYGPMYYLPSEPFNTITSTVAIKGLFDRMQVAGIPLIDSGQLEYFRETSNFVTLNLDSNAKWMTNQGEILQASIDDAISMLLKQIESDPSKGSLKQVVYFERDTDDQQTWFKSTRTDSPYLIHFQDLNGKGNPTELVFITNGTFCTNEVGSTLTNRSNYCANFNVSGGNLYFLSMGYVSRADFFAVGTPNESFYQSYPNQPKPQINIASTRSADYNVGYFSFAVEGSPLDIFIYYPHMPIRMYNSTATPWGTTAPYKDQYRGGFITRALRTDSDGLNSSSIQTGSVWTGDPKIYGYE